MENPSSPILDVPRTIEHVASQSNFEYPNLDHLSLGARPKTTIDEGRKATADDVEKSTGTRLKYFEVMKL